MLATGVSVKGASYQISWHQAELAFDDKGTLEAVPEYPEACLAQSSY